MLLLASKLKNLPSRKCLLSVDEKAEPGPRGQSVLPTWRASTGTGSCCDMSPGLPNCWQVLFDLVSPGFPVPVPPSVLGLFCFAGDSSEQQQQHKHHSDIFRNHLFTPSITCCNWFPAPVLSLLRVCVKVHPEVSCWGHSLA